MRSIHVRSPIYSCSLVVFTTLVALLPGPLSAVETFVVEIEGRQHVLVGKPLVEAQDGGVLLLAVDGAIWPLEPQIIKSRQRDDRPFALLDRQQLAERLVEEMPGYSVFHTQHYVVVYNTSQAYAQWCGSLFERLFRAFFNFWKIRGWELQPPPMPLVALVFDGQERYLQYASSEIGPAAQSLFGYYSMKTNRIAMYDLTGADELKRLRPRLPNTTHLNLLLAQPEAERLVATVIHEATHQVAYNSGLQVRFAGNPMWVSEGLATFFETPDLRNDRGWRTVGAVNRLHWTRFRDQLPSRSPDAILRLLTDDARFHNPQTVADAYSEAWAITYFLLNRHPSQFVEYLKKLSQKSPLQDDPSSERVREFREVFGDLEALDAEFVKYMNRLRP